MPEIKTVKIVVPSHPDGVVTINESDFAASVHTLYSEDAPHQPAKTSSEDAPQTRPRKAKIQ